MAMAPHALLVPASGQGHINGCMLLARALCATGFSVSLVYFSSAHRKLRLPQEDPAIPTHIVQDGVDAEGPYFAFSVTEAMKKGLQELVERLGREAKPVTCIVSDSFCSWTQDVARKLHLPRIDYWTSTALSYLMITNWHRLTQMGILPEKGGPPLWRSKNPIIIDIPGLPSMPMEHLPGEMRFSDPSNPFPKLFADVAMWSKEAERILIHGLSELEPTAFEAFKEAQIPAFAIGPLLHHADATGSGSQEQAPCITWLDTQAPSSVIYVAFGSHASLSPQELIELAFGLESTNQPFLWAVRQDQYQGELSDVLPQGFLSRTKDRGLIVGWAPQVEVLAHPSIAGFFSHCGWNSTLESLWAGVPIVGCPRIAEQRSNAHYITQVWKVGVEVERTDSGQIERGHVEAAINTLMKDVEGEKVRSKAREVMQLARKTCRDGGVSKCNLEKFYEDMKARCQV